MRGSACRALRAGQCDRVPHGPPVAATCRGGSLALLASKPLQAALTAHLDRDGAAAHGARRRRAIRPLWMVGAALLAVVVGKLFLLDLSSLSGLPRVVAFLGVGVLLLVIGYLAPLPPAAKKSSGARSRPADSREGVRAVAVSSTRRCLTPRALRATLDRPPRAVLLMSGNTFGTLFASPRSANRTARRSAAWSTAARREWRSPRPTSSPSSTAAPGHVAPRHAAARGRHASRSSPACSRAAPPARRSRS